MKIAAQEVCLSHRWNTYLLTYSMTYGMTLYVDLCIHICMNVLVVIVMKALVLNNGLLLEGLSEPWLRMYKVWLIHVQSESLVLYD